MMMTRRRVAGAAVLLWLSVAGAGCVPPAAAGYRMERLRPPGGEASESMAVAVNNAGLVLGLVDDAVVLWTDGEPTTLDPYNSGALLNERGDVAAGAVVWRDGTPTTMVTPTGARAIALDQEGRVLLGPDFAGPGQAYYLWDDGELQTLTGFPTDGWVRIVGRNTRGQVAGVVYAGLRGPPVYSFVWQDGVVTRLGPLGPGGGPTVALAINEQGQVAGEGTVAGGATHAFRWQDGVVTDVGSFPGGDVSRFAALGAAGDVVGSGATAAGENHAFRWRDGTMVDLGTLGGGFSEASGVNARGDVIGRSTVDRTGTSPMHAVVWRDGRMIDLETDGSQSSAADINDLGQIVGRTYRGSSLEAVLWTPRDRPGS
jgi:probable HAF family extracellular repeat protein